MKTHYPQESVESGFNARTICNRYYLSEVGGSNLLHEVTCKFCLNHLKQ